MPDNDLKKKLSILVVDDMKFSCVFVRRVLNNEGFQDVRITNSVQDALRLLSERPVDVILADWVMPEMDGLQLTARVRELDQQRNHYTGIILLTAKEGSKPLYQAFDGGIDDYLTKPPNNKELAARTYATGRMAQQQSAMLARIHLQHDQLQGVCTIDPITQLENERGFLRRAEPILKETQARGGVLGVCLVRLEQAILLRQKSGERTHNEVLNCIARRLRRSVRPSDTIARINDNEFAIAIPFGEEQQARSRSMQKLQRTLNFKPVKTSDGYHSIQTSLAFSYGHCRDSELTTEDLLSSCRSQLAGLTQSNGYNQAAE